MGKTHFFLVLVFFQQLHAQVTKTWTGATSSAFNTPTNWSPSGAPGNSDDVLFNGTSSANCNFNVNQQFRNITIATGYNGTITAAANATVGGNFSQTSGTFRCASQNITFKGNVTVSGGTFAHNNGTVTLQVANGATNTISGSPAFNYLTISGSNTGALQRNLNFGTASGSTVNLQGGLLPFAYQGTISISSLLLINGTDNSALVNNNGVFRFNGSSARVTSAVTAGMNKLGSLQFSTAGSIALSGNISLTGSLIATQSGVFTAGTSTLNFYEGSGAVLTSAGVAASADNVLIDAAASLQFSGSSQLAVYGHLLNNGTLTSNTGVLYLAGAGTQSVAGTSTLTTLNALAVTGSGTKTLYHSVNILDSLKMSAGTLSTGGLLTLKSGSALKGRIASIGAGSTISGGVKVETYAAAGRTDWNMLGVSGISSQKIANWEGQIPMTCSFCPNGPYATSNYFVSVLGWDETATANSAQCYPELIYTSELTPGKGFWVYLGSAMYNTSAYTWTVSGTAVTGNVSMPLTNSGATKGDGFNLLSNPYASPISWNKLRNGSTAVDNAIYVYNPDLGVMTSYAGGVSTPSGAASANDVIPMGQAFYVRCNTATATLTAQESNKVPYNTSSNPLLRQASAAPLWRIRLAGPGGLSDETVIHLADGTSSAYDAEWDAEKIASHLVHLAAPEKPYKRPTIATELDGRDYAINAFPSSDTSGLRLPMPVFAPVTSAYTISAVAANLPEGSCLVLWDEKEQRMHDLSRSPYVCSITEGNCRNRFFLHLSEKQVVLGAAAQSIPQMRVTQEADGVRIQNISGQAVVRIFAIDGSLVSESHAGESAEHFIPLERSGRVLLLTATASGEHVAVKLVH